MECSQKKKEPYPTIYPENGNPELLRISFKEEISNSPAASQRLRHQTPDFCSWQHAVSSLGSPNISQAQTRPSNSHTETHHFSLIRTCFRWSGEFGESKIYMSMTYLLS